ncbi:hypothetical protein ACHAXT_006296 [Thalassiosira profunda]
MNEPYSYAGKAPFGAGGDDDSISEEGGEVSEPETEKTDAPKEDDITKNESEREFERLETMETESKTESSSETGDVVEKGDDSVVGGELRGEGIDHAEEKDDEGGASSDDEFHEAKAEMEEPEIEETREDPHEACRAHAFNLEETIRELRATVVRQGKKIESLEGHVAKTSEARAFWEEQSAKLSFELQDMQQLKEVQETELGLLRERVESDDDKIGTLLSEVGDLKSMQQVLERKLSTAKEEEREALQSLKDEVDQLLAEREKALAEARALREMYQRSIEQHEGAITALRRDADARSDELEHARALLQESEGQLQSMRDRDEAHAGDRAVRLETMAEELKGQREKVSELEHAAELHTFAVGGMKRRMTQKDGEIERLSSQLEEEAAEKAKLSSELEKERGLVAEYKQTTDAMKADSAEKDNTMQELSDMLAEATQKQSKEDLELSGFVVNNLKKKLSEKDAEIEKMGALLESAAENGDEIQGFVIGSQKKKMSQMESELQTLASQLAAEKAKGQSKAEEAAHYKDYAITLEQRQGDKEMANIANQRKLTKRIFNLQKELAEHERKGTGVGQHARTISRTMSASDDGTSLDMSSILFDTGGSVGSASDHYSIDTSWEAKHEKNTLEQLLCRVLAERDKLAIENEELKLANERLGASPPSGTTVGEYLSLAREKEIAELQKRLVDLTAEKKTLESWKLVADATETSDDTSKEECLVMLQSIQEEQAELEAKLKLLLEDKKKTANPDDSKEVTFSELPPKQLKPPKRTQVYQLTCRECNNVDLNYVGKTRRDLKRQMKYHFDDVWRIVRKEHLDGLETCPVAPPDDDEPASDFPLSPFAKHFTRHCRNASSYDECLRWCSSNIKVQRQKINDWEQLAEEDGLVRTVYQLSCRCCKNHHYIGSTLETLKKKVIKHYSEIWDLVQKEYGDGGFMEDTAHHAVKMGKFGTSAAHFAKHCKHANSIRDIDKWCEANIKIEKWVMVCRNCLGTAVDTNLNTKNSSIMSFKVEHTLGKEEKEKKKDEGDGDAALQSPGSQRSVNTSESHQRSTLTLDTQTTGSTTEGKN